MLSSCRYRWRARSWLSGRSSGPPVFRRRERRNATEEDHGQAYKRRLGATLHLHPVARVEVAAQSLDDPRSVRGVPPELDQLRVLGCSGSSMELDWPGSRVHCSRRRRLECQVYVILLAYVGIQVVIFQNFRIGIHWLLLCLNHKYRQSLSETSETTRCI